MSFNDVAIKVDSICKSFAIYKEPKDRVKQLVLPPIRSALGKEPHQYFTEFKALENISFEVKKGETVGILGKNGSGKSTLLQLICGTLTPTSGSVRTVGRISALLELGSGFQPEFTGRENIILNATILGLSRGEIEQVYEDVVAFADIGDFIDRPIKTYSSGMLVRLAFAVQSQINPDILIVDEALAVGDAKFQAKCFDRLEKLKDNGTSILLVTHSSEQIVTHCSSALLLNEGKQIEFGNPRKLVNRYMDLLFGKDKPNQVAVDSAKHDNVVQSNSRDNYGLSDLENAFSERLGYNPEEYRWGDGKATILDFYLDADGNQYPTHFTTGQRVKLAVYCRFNVDLIRPVMGVTIKTKEGVTVYGTNTGALETGALPDIVTAGSLITVDVDFDCHLAPGDYFISLGLATKEGEEAIPHDRRYDSIHLQVLPDPRFFGLVDLKFKMNAD